VSALFVAPLDVVKARRQIQSVAPGADGVPRYRGTLSSLRLIFELEGVRGLFRGLPPTLLGCKSRAPCSVPAALSRHEHP
jgi:solute carrier family 25 folate transporter 32